MAINKIGNIVIENKWNELQNSLDLFSDDFMSGGREQSGGQEREEL